MRPAHRVVAVWTAGLGRAARGAAPRPGVADRQRRAGRRLLRGPVRGQGHEPAAAALRRAAHPAQGRARPARRVAAAARARGGARAVAAGRDAGRGTRGRGRGTRRSRRRCPAARHAAAGGDARRVRRRRRLLPALLVGGDAAVGPGGDGRRDCPSSPRTSATSAGPSPTGSPATSCPPKEPRRSRTRSEPLLTDPALRRRMGAAGRARVAEKFSVEVTADQVSALYAELVRSPPMTILCYHSVAAGLGVPAGGRAGRLRPAGRLAARATAGPAPRRRP